MEIDEESTIHKLKSSDGERLRVLESAKVCVGDAGLLEVNIESFVGR